MIFGKTYQEKHTKISDILKNGFSMFALVPKQLDDGRYVWLEMYWAKFHDTYAARDMYTQKFCPMWWVKYKCRLNRSAVEDEIVRKLKGE